jgi:integrase
MGYVHRFARGANGTKRPELPVWPDDAVTRHKSKSRKKDGMGPDDIATWWRNLRARVRDNVKHELLLFELLSGLRSGDARTAAWADLNEKDRWLYIREPKGGPDKAFHLPVRAHP